MAEFRLALSYLKGRPIRTIMTVLSIVIGVMMMFGLNGMAPALKDIFISSTSSMALSDVDVYITRNDGSFFREAYQQNVAAVQGVESTASMIVRAMAVPAEQYYTPEGREITSIQVYGIDTSSNDPAFNIVTAGGRRLTAGRHFADWRPECCPHLGDLCRGAGHWRGRAGEAARRRRLDEL